MQMDAGLDTGDMLLTEAVAIGPEETTAGLHDRLAALGAQALLQVLDLRAQGALRPQAQPAEGVTYAHKIEKAEAAIAWTQAAVAIERRIRAFDPFPGCIAELGGQTVKVWRARVAPDSGAPGQVLQADGGRLVVACGTGALELLELQLPGGKRIAARDFLLRHPLAAG
jgi:methionyl-tRNA formyltransferase